jgi:hypothetical protein
MSCSPRTFCLIMAVCWLSAAPFTNAQIQFGEPEPILGEINEVGDNVDPHLTANGRGMYFASNRPGNRGEADIWFAHRPSASSPWEGVTRLDDAINSSESEQGPFISATGLELFFHRGNTSGITESNDL